MEINMPHQKERTMRKSVLLTLTLLLMINLHGQDSKMNDVRTLMDYTGMDKLGHQMADGVFSMYKSTYGEDIPGLWDTLNVVMNEGIADLMDSIAVIYASVYTQDDIKAMLELYQTPLGRKMIEAMPLISDLSMKAGQNWAKANTPQIQERIAPLIEKYTKKEYTYDDFYLPDEQYEYDRPKTVSDSKLNETTVKGSPEYKYSIHYNPKEWDKVPNETINPVADLTFISKNKQVYAMVIAETSTMTLQQLKAAAIFNMSNVAENVTTESMGLRKVNGKELLCLRLNCLIQEDTYSYYNYYYSGDWGVLQFVVFSTEEHALPNQKTIEGILSGLFVE